ncbi:protein kinase [Oscillochloris sp. ZM17-4]|uniref:serine/threonine-protein kinase n=1 Tax=Oscillochloris sp. ZM17-4 TaxID=2866714 RepID=UPI00351CB835
MSELNILQVGDIVHERYRILAPIGRGGMGAVYLAEDIRLSSQVALKQLLVGGAQLDRAFEREAKLLANLRHPALPVVSDYFADAGGQFLVMQHIPGDDMAALLARRGGPLPVDQVLTWAGALLDALEYLHGQSPPVIHRDIKPQNMKLTPRGEVFLIDFGLARGAAVMQTRITSGGSLLAYTPAYAPMEQIQGGAAEARSDLYALAATLHHLLTGAVPPSALDRAAAIVAGRPDPLRPVAELNPLLPPHLSAAISAGLAMAIAQRPPSAAAMRAALMAAPAAPAVTGATIHPTGAPPPDRAGAPIWLWATLGVLAALLVLAVGVWLLRPARPAALADTSVAPTQALASTEAPTEAPTEVSSAVAPTAVPAQEPAAPKDPPAPTEAPSPTPGSIVAQPVAAAPVAAQPPASPLLLRDSFDSPSGGWDPAYSSENGSNGYDSGGYRFSVARTPDWMMWDVDARPAAYGDATYSVDVTLLDGAGKLGIFLAYSGEAAAPDSASYYRVVVGSDGRLDRIERRAGGALGSLEISRPAEATPFVIGVARRLSVRQEVGQLVVSLDGQEIGRAAGGGLGPGRVGLFGESGAGVVSVRYDNLEVVRLR